MSASPDAPSNPWNQQPDWTQSEYGQRYHAAEAHLLKSSLKSLSGPRVLQIGELIDQRLLDHVDFPQLIVAAPAISRSGRVELLADPAFLPIQAESMASVVLPHVLEIHKLPHQVLREVHRVLSPDGRLLITGFSPFSLLGIQRWARPQAVLSGNYYTVHRVVDWLQLLGFEVVASGMCQYAPLTKSVRIARALNWLESVGDRWLPMMGGAYTITARKRTFGTTMVGPLRFAKSKSKLANAAPARTAWRGNITHTS